MTVRSARDRRRLQNTASRLSIEVDDGDAAEAMNGGFLSLELVTQTVVFRAGSRHGHSRPQFRRSRGLRLARPACRGIAMAGNGFPQCGGGRAMAWAHWAFGACCLVRGETLRFGGKSDDCCAGFCMSASSASRIKKARERAAASIGNNCHPSIGFSAGAHGPPFALDPLRNERGCADPRARRGSIRQDQQPGPVGSPTAFTAPARSSIHATPYEDHADNTMIPIRRTWRPEEQGECRNKGQRRRADRSRSDMNENTTPAGGTGELQ